MKKALKVALYIFLLGAGTYAWWKYTMWIKEKIKEAERENERRGASALL